LSQDYAMTAQFRQSMPMRSTFLEITAFALFVTMGASYTSTCDALTPEGSPAAEPATKSYFTQPILVPGQVIDGSIAVTDLSHLGVNIVDCYQIRTEPSSRWVITMESSALPPYIMLTVGESCGSVLTTETAANKQGKPAKLQFESKGGVYLVLVASLSPGLYGSYTLRMDPLVGKVKEKELTKPHWRGLQAVMVPSGTASTVGGKPMSKLAAGTTIKDCEACPELVVVPSGSFMMGSPSTEEGRSANEGPRHRVTITKPFAIGKFEVTQKEWFACRDEGGCRNFYDRPDAHESLGPKLPIYVTHFHAAEYVDWLSKKTGRQYFLPSEAEWEYATRAGTDTPWNTGDAILTEDANFLSSRKADVPVGQYPPNAFGLYDTHGNYAEWVQDCLVDESYFGVPTDGSAMESESPSCVRILRGGLFRSEPAGVRSAVRFPVKTIDASGFRVTRALDDTLANPAK
jgi:formylglycine-generating enzyme required for sulfatase activity